MGDVKQATQVVNTIRHKDVPISRFDEVMMGFGVCMYGPAIFSQLRTGELTKIFETKA